MNTYIHDVRDFGAVGDGIADDSNAFNKAIQHATDKGGKVVASGRFKMANALTVTCDCDFSQATLVVDSAGIRIAHTRGYLDSHQKEFVLSDKSRLTTLQSSLQGVLDDATLAAFENSWVRLIAEGDNSIYIYRSEANNPIQIKGSVSLLNKHGRLAYSLNHDYTQVQTVRLRLRRLPDKRLTFISPRFEVVNFPIAGGYLLSVARDLVNVVDFTLNHGAPDQATETYYGMIGIHDCYDVIFENTSTPGFGTTNNEPGVPSKVRYDIMLGTALKVRLDNVNSATGWKTVDGNSYRDLHIRNANLYGLHGHFNACDITLEHCRIHSGGISIGTGAPDSSIIVRNCTFTSKAAGAVSLRPDYGELRGRVLIENCRLYMSSMAQDGRVVQVLSLQESAIRVRDQPWSYSLPSSIVIRNVQVQCKGDCSIIGFNEGAPYNDKRRLHAPLDITVENVTLESRDKGDLIFKYAFIPYDYASAPPVAIHLRKLENLDGEVLVTLSGSATQHAEKQQFSVNIEAIENLRATLIAGQRSTVNIQHCRLLALNTRTGGDARLKRLSVSHCTFLFDRDFALNTHLSVSPGIQSALFGNCVFDASAYRTQTGNLLAIAALAHVTEGGMSIDCHGSGSADATKGLKIVTPLRGSDGCFSTQADGTLLPLRS